MMPNDVYTRLSAGTICRRGYGLIGLLITIACIAILLSIIGTSLNKVTTGEGSTAQNTVRSFKDQTSFHALNTGLAVYAQENRNRLPQPSQINPYADRDVDTTANLYSAMIMQNLVAPSQVISANEYSSVVWAMEDYNYHAMSPAEGVYWDPRFKADLERESHTSFAHMPLFGERLQRRWAFGTGGGRFPLIGNRGPKDGVHDPNSMSYGRSRQWAGQFLLSDGSVEFTDSFTPAWLQFSRDGQVYSDNLFAFDDGVEGADAMMTFTKQMESWGPVVQFD